VWPEAAPMRDVIAGIVAVALLLAAASLGTTLRLYQRRRRRRRDSEQARGRTIVAEIPTEDELALFTEDADAFHWSDKTIAKASILAVRVLINGSPLVAYESRRARHDDATPPTSFVDRPEGIARDRWDVAIETDAPRNGDRGVVLVECGAIRERVSQELARAVFDAVKREVEHRDG
jgi:hypothetical protein